MSLIPSAWVVAQFEIRGRVDFGSLPPRDGFVPVAPIVEPELGSVAHSRGDSEISTEPRPGVYPGAV